MTVSTRLRTERGDVVEPVIQAFLLPDDAPAQLAAGVLARTDVAEVEGAARFRGLGPKGHEVLAKLVLQEVRRVLNDHLVDLSVGAWRTRRAVIEAGRESLGRPGVVHQVPMLSHTVRIRQDPQVEISVHGVHLATLHVALDASVQVADASAVVRDGRLVAVHCDDLPVEAHLWLEGVEIARNRGMLGLGGEIDLGDGVVVASSGHGEVSEAGIT